MSASDNTKNVTLADDAIGGAILGLVREMITAVMADKEFDEFAIAKRVNELIAGHRARSIEEASGALITAAKRAEQILDRNLHRQNEKCDDAITILRRAIASHAERIGQ